MGNNRISGAVFAGALVAGTSYMLAAPLGLGGPVAIVWKGAGVALLAVWCAMQARDRDGWLIAAVMAFGTLGDVLLETAGLTTGAVAFLVGHAIAFVLYRRNRRAAIKPSQRLLAWTVAIGGPFITVLIVRDILSHGVPLYGVIAVYGQLFGMVIYSTAVSIMAAMAWTSRFPRYRVGIGAMMFLASDLLIFAKLGPLAASPMPGLLIWPLYFGGQVLIAWGVTQTLARREA